MTRVAPGAAPGGVHGFAAALTSFVGRAEEVREVTGLLAEYRLVTVTGPGGMGKTRLAGEVARFVVGRFADGAWLAELATVREPALPRSGALPWGQQRPPGTWRCWRLRSPANRQDLPPRRACPGSACGSANS